jgi:hypothetical protein
MFNGAIPPKNGNIYGFPLICKQTHSFGLDFSHLIVICVD